MQQPQQQKNNFQLGQEYNILQILDLKVNQLDDKRICKRNYLKKLQIHQNLEQRIQIHLAFEALCNQNFKKRIKNGCFKLDLVEDDPDIAIILIILQDSNRISELFSKRGIEFIIWKDAMARSHLYVAVKYENLEMVQTLMSIGINVNEQQTDLSTPLHCAAFYGKKDMVKLLLIGGANPHLQNQHKITPIDEANNEEIKNLLKTNSKYLDFIRELRNIKEDLQISFNIEGQSINCIYVQNPFQDYSEFNNQVGYYHGTKLQNVISILNHGLLIPGQKNPENLEIKRPSFHISSKIKFKNIENYARAVFVSKSPFYAANESYSECLNIFENKMNVLIHCYTDEVNCTDHSGTISGYKLKQDENKLLETRIEENKMIKILGVFFVNQEKMKALQNFKEFDFQIKPQENFLLKDFQLLQTSEFTIYSINDN